MLEDRLLHLQAIELSRMKTRIAETQLAAHPDTARLNWALSNLYIREPLPQGVIKIHEDRQDIDDSIAAIAAIGEEGQDAD